MNKNITNCFIPLKWIFLFLLIFNFAQAQNLEESGLKQLKVENYISDFEEYNEEIINVRKDPTKKRSSQPNTMAREAIYKISSILSGEMKLKKDKSERLATIIAFSAKKYEIDPRIMIAIMKVESNFNQNAVNLVSCERTKQTKCGDYSIAQINYEVWSKAFPKMGRKPLDLQRLKTDETYAIFRMGEILNILKSQYPQDKLWFARYHSSTPEHKKRYTNVLKKELRKVIALGPNLMKSFPKKMTLSSNP